MNPRLKAKGRALGAMRIGAQDARRYLTEGRPGPALQALDRALRRAERLERDA